MCKNAKLLPMGGFFNERENSHRGKEEKEITKMDILKKFFTIRIGD
jgi:hypothetical protein